jgi:hypothetical protein
MAQKNPKLYPVQAYVSGVLKWIGVFCTEKPDSLGGGAIFCGEYDPARAYSLNNVVQRTTGANRGTWYYISSTASTGSSGANPTVDPWVNSNGSWAELFPANTNDQWQ